MTTQTELSENEPEQIAVAVPETETATETSANENLLSDQEINWKRANEVMRAQKYKIDELEKRLASLPAPVKTADSIPAPAEDDDFDIDPDDYVTGAMLKKMHAKTAKLEAELRREQQKALEKFQNEKIAASEARAQQQFSDYDTVVDNFALPLIQSDPVIAQLLNVYSDPAALAYSLGKTEQIKQPKTAAKNPTAEKILKNSEKPSSVFASGNSLKSQAENFSNLSPSEIWKMSEQYARGGN